MTYRCVVVALSSHGGQRQRRAVPEPGLEECEFWEEYDVLYGTDGPFAVEELTDIFNEKNCPKLTHKPKLFFFQVS